MHLCRVVLLFQWHSVLKTCLLCFLLISIYLCPSLILYRSIYLSIYLSSILVHPWLNVFVLALLLWIFSSFPAPPPPSLLPSKHPCPAGVIVLKLLLDLYSFFYFFFWSMILSTSTKELKLIYRKEGGGYIQNRWQMRLRDPVRGCARAGWGSFFFFFFFLTTPVQSPLFFENLFVNFHTFFF